MVDRADKIDFVVPWLDSSDQEWQKQYHHYKGVEYTKDDARFRN